MTQTARWVLGLAIMLGAWPVAGCHHSGDSNRSTTDAVKYSGPAEYSATVVRTVESGSNSQIEQTRVVVSGSLLREEWTELGHRRALILRPDLGKSYVLWMDKKEYTETDYTTPAPATSMTGGPPPEITTSGKAAISSGVGKRPISPQKEPDVKSPSQPTEDLGDWAIDPDETAPSVTSEGRDLPNQTIDGHDCKVREEVRVFADGHTERVVSFNAIDLNGLAIRIEAESGSGAARSRVVTERRDVNLKVSASEFVVPEGFKPVEDIPAKAR